jgi:hypothetical protein
MVQPMKIVSLVLKEILVLKTITTKLLVVHLVHGALFQLTTCVKNVFTHVLNVLLLMLKLVVVVKLHIP